MLIEPSLEKLLTKADSKFSIVSMVAQRVRQLNKGWKPLVDVVAADGSTIKPVGIALKEIAEGKITMHVDGAAGEACAAASGDEEPLCAEDGEAESEAGPADQEQPEEDGRA